MKKLLKKLKLGKHFARYASLFDKRTYGSFKSAIEIFVYCKDAVQADMAEEARKSLSAIQYFFQYAKWQVSKLNQARLSVLRNKKETKDRVTDMLILDGSALAKDKNTVSEGISRIWDNRKKQSVNGFELFGAGIVTAEGIYYPLNVMIFLKKNGTAFFRHGFHF